jgi:hypothetical protein
VPTDGEVKAIGRITGDSSRVFEGTGEILLEDGTVAAEGRGRYVKMALADISEEGFAENEWFADDLTLPEEVDL